jgi:nitrogen fixation protein NifB
VLNDTEQRPGVTSQIITPLEALDVVRKAVALSPDLTVVGIAGPGDTLATPYAFETFRLIRHEFPDLIKCMSTNGLLLPEKSDELIGLDVKTLTVTVNAVNPNILPLLNNRIIYHGKSIDGSEGSAILIRNQLEGIRKVSAAGVVVKVNTVLVPEVNGAHIGEIAEAVKGVGASLYNIIPLIPQNELSWCDPPNCAQIDEARRIAEEHIQVFRHCQHCRADAIGVPGGEDLGEQIYKKRVLRENTFSHG